MPTPRFPNCTKLFAAAFLIACLPFASAAEPKALPTKPDKDGWIDLLGGGNLNQWKKPAAGKWQLADGVLSWNKGGGDLWTKDVFGDFTIDLEVKCTKNSNSGVYLRGPVGGWHGMEIQIYHSHSKKPGIHDMGALYDCQAPSVAAEKPIGEWNHLVITIVGNRLQVVLNEKPILDANLDRWPEVGKNPDGTVNKFERALKDLPRIGHVGLQDHGTPIWYRNVRIKRLDQKQG